MKKLLLILICIVFVFGVLFMGDPIGYNPERVSTEADFIGYVPAYSVTLIGYTVETAYYIRGPPVA